MKTVRILEDIDIIRIRSIANELYAMAEKATLEGRDRAAAILSGRARDLVEIIGEKLEVDKP